MQGLYLGGLAASADSMPDITRRMRLAWAYYNRFKREFIICGGCPVLSKNSHAEHRGDGDLAIRVSDVESWPVALR